MVGLKFQAGALSAIAAAFCSATASAGSYSTQIYSVATDADSGVLYIDGADLAPSASPENAYVQVLGKTLRIRSASSNSGHIEAELPAGLTLYPGTGYQLYVSPDLANAASRSTATDQGYFTLYVPSKMTGIETAVQPGQSKTGGSATANATTSTTGASSGNSTFLSGLVSTFRTLQSASGTSTASVTPDNGSTFSLPYSGSLASSGSVFSVTNTSSGDAIDATNSSTATNATALKGLISSTSSSATSTAVRGANNGTSNSGIGVWGSHAGTGIGVYGTTVTGTGVRGVASGGGVGLVGLSNTGRGLYATSTSGIAGYFTLGSSNASDAVEILTAGTGRGLFINDTNTSTSANAFEVTSAGNGVIFDSRGGNAGNFFVNNTNSVGAGVRGEVNTIFGNAGAAGVHGVASGTGGYGGYFEQNNSSGYGTALVAYNTGLGTGAAIYNSSSGNASPALQVITYGTGNSLAVANYNNQSTANIVSVTTNGQGSINDRSQGNAGNFFVNNTEAVAAGVRGEVNSIYANYGTAGIYGVSSGTGGYAGYFASTDTNGNGTGVYIGTAGHGTPLVVDSEGASNLFIATAGGVSKARIDAAGKGYFDGGTQNSGADLAEFVPTIGSLPQVGDVVEIDPDHPNSFRLCSEANTTRVAGIISTAPGVTLNARHGSEDEVSGPALALAGRVPTKVNNAGGAIHIGDLLVASAEPGRAMRAPQHPEPGTVIGKALQDSDEPEGTVEVLVMLR